MGIKMIAFDLDGTVLRNDKTISKRTIDAFYKASQKGIILVPTTGRFFMGIPEEIRNLPFIKYAICINGAEVYDRENDKLIYEAGIAKEDVKLIWDYIDEFPGMCSVYQSGKGMMSKEDYDNLYKCDIDKALLSAIRNMYTPVENLRELVFSNKDSVQKIQSYSYTSEQKEQKMTEMIKHFPQFMITSSIPVNIEVNAHNATKGIGLEELSKYLNIPIDECMAIGDGTNDTSMIIKAGVGVAMENAVQEVLDAANVITLSNDNDGVAEIIEKCI